MTSAPHCLTLRVYYEDTDLAGIVYYANYLKFIERGRSEWLRAAGIDQQALKDREGVVFAVRRIEADYLAPARFDDMLCVSTTATAASPARLEVDQTVTRRGQVLFTARVTIAALGPSGRPVRLPAAVRAALM